jgi:hypothetical protein
MDKPKNWCSLCKPSVTWLAAVCLLFSLPAFAQQDSAMLDKRFEFRDGVYLTFEELQNNTPAYSWKELDTKLASSSSGASAQAEYIIVRASGDTLSKEGLWGISLNGLPYICLQDQGAGSTAMRFASLKVRGRLCLFTFETEKKEWVEIAAYNPLTGKPFRKGKVSKEVQVTHEFLLDFTTGEIQPFKKNNLLQLIKEDHQLWRTVNELSEDEADDKLYRCLLIYDDRNPIYLPLNNND